VKSLSRRQSTNDKAVWQSRFLKANSRTYFGLRWKEFSKDVEIFNIFGLDSRNNTQMFCKTASLVTQLPPY
jgi:hypothetical protein